MPRELPSLPSATWLDECLLAARSQNKLTGVRFGRKGDPLCARADDALRSSLDDLERAALGSHLSVYTVDIDEVPEFTYMYELYDPFTIMLFHRSKPLIFDAGHGQTRKITEMPGSDLAKLLKRILRQALELETSLEAGLNAAKAVAGSSSSDRHAGAAIGDERPDDAATWNEEAQRVARQTAGWLSERLTPALDRSGELLQQAEVSGWAAWERARERSRVALESARHTVLQKVNDSLGPAEGDTNHDTHPPDKTATGHGVIGDATPGSPVQRQ